MLRTVQVMLGYILLMEWGYDMYKVCERGRVRWREMEKKKKKDVKKRGSRGNREGEIPSAYARTGLGLVLFLMSLFIHFAFFYFT
jgi:hypothetical protein